jgi:FkbM family methyltransferase
VTPTLSDRFLSAYAHSGRRGFARLWRLCGRRPGDTVNFLSRYGTSFDLDPWAYIDSIVLRQGYYESEVLEAIVAELGIGDVLWDIGANIGLHGLTAKKLVPEAEVICFEPSPAILGRLWRNRFLNNLDVRVVPTALSDNRDLHAFYIAPPGNPGMSTLSPWSGAKYESQTVVATVPGDELVGAGRLAAPTVIKLEVEGHEEAVLRGLTHVLASSCRIVVFEDAPEGNTPAKALLAHLGYCFEPLVRKEASHHGLVNILARRQ